MTTPPRPDFCGIIHAFVLLRIAHRMVSQCGTGLPEGTRLRCTVEHHGSVCWELVHKGRTVAGLDLEVEGLDPATGQMAPRLAVSRLTATPGGDLRLRSRSHPRTAHAVREAVGRFLSEAIPCRMPGDSATIRCRCGRIHPEGNWPKRITRIE